MRRPAVAAGLAALTVLAVPGPGYAFAHDRVANPYWHMALDVLTFAVVTAPLWTAQLWGDRPRAGLLAVVAVIQVPVAVVGFTPILDPVAHTIGLLAALCLTAVSLRLVREPALVLQRQPAG